MTNLSNRLYFTLTPRGSNTFHKEGESLSFSDRIVNIGETSDCDIRYESAEAQLGYYASILRNEDGESWRIVKRSSHARILIDGQGNIGYAYQLKDGDIIRFENQPMSLTFRIHREKSSDDWRKRRIWQACIAACFILATVLTIWLTSGNREDVIKAEDVAPLEESIYMVKVDSVYWIKIQNGAEEVLSTKILTDDAPTGTAFHTTDGRIVTARHCVEYWITKNIDLTTNINELPKDDIIRWAIETETFNQTHAPDSSKCLRVFFTLYDFLGNRKCSYSSTDKTVKMRTERDGIYQLADFSNDYYWRSIRPCFVDRQMELDDILWIDSVGEGGKVRLANDSDLEQVQNGMPLVIFGYPMTDKGNKRIIFTEGTIRRSTSEDNTMLSFESNITHGFSGGPVLMKSGGDIVAIGVVSRVDSISSGIYKSAVPTTEILQQK